jgi:pectinesterase
VRIADCGLRIAAVLAAIVSLSAQPAPHRVRIVLVGDSTVTDDKGWGLGFRRFVTRDAEVINEAASGRSSKSYLDEGRWAKALAARGDYYVIQFGHNDEPGKGPDRETDPRTTFTANLAKYVADVRALGATPILVTSLTRRAFDGDRVKANLDAYVDATKAIAAHDRVPLVDLHSSSIALAEQMGNTAWEAISPKTADGGIDRTHLTARSSALVARLVADELRTRAPSLASSLARDPSQLAVVSADGTGDYTTVQAAIDAVPQSTSADHRWTIFLQAGTYHERVYVQREKRFVVLTAADASNATITYDLHASMVGPDGLPIGTFRTPTLQVDADDFTAEHITVENGAGPVGQALAMRVDGDRAVFRQCRFVGWQDTILLNRGRQYFEDSYISGHVDFIFGGATAWFERCTIYCRRDGYITAASTPKEAPTGFVFANGVIDGDPSAHVYLGRPWRDFAQVTFIATQMASVVRPQGWHNWDRPEREQTSRYREFGSRGPGGDPARRVGWSHPLTADEARALTPQGVLAGVDGWNPLAR